MSEKESSVAIQISENTKKQLAEMARFINDLADGMLKHFGQFSKAELCTSTMFVKLEWRYDRIDLRIGLWSYTQREDRDHGFSAVKDKTSPLWKVDSKQYRALIDILLEVEKLVVIRRTMREITEVAAK